MKSRYPKTVHKANGTWFPLTQELLQPFLVRTRTLTELFYVLGVFDRVVPDFSLVDEMGLECFCAIRFYAREPVNIYDVLSLKIYIHGEDSNDRRSV